MQFSDVVSAYQRPPAAGARMRIRGPEPDIIDETGRINIEVAMERQRKFENAMREQEALIKRGIANAKHMIDMMA